MVAKGIWLYYVLRAIDLFDTFILILRKKNSHLSLLHTYHHATMFPIWWVGARFIAGGNCFFGPLLNSFVHILMYAYYGIAELGPAYRKYLWWKRYLTVVQMVQFVLVIGHSAQTLLSGCHQPLLFLHYAQMFYLLTLLGLFANFYYKSYSTKKVNTSPIMIIITVIIYINYIHTHTSITILIFFYFRPPQAKPPRKRNNDL